MGVGGVARKRRAEQQFEMKISSEGKHGINYSAKGQKSINTMRRDMVQYASK